MRADRQNAPLPAELLSTKTAALSRLGKLSRFAENLSRSSANSAPETGTFVDEDVGVGATM